MNVPDWRRLVGERLTLPQVTSAREALIVEEVAQQLDEAYREALRHGATEAEARAAAEAHVPDWDAFSRQLAETGGLEHQSADERVIDLLESRPAPATRGSGWTGLAGDVLQAVRSLRRSPGFALVAVLTLALGIGANAAVFGVVDGVLLRSLPFPDAHRLVMVWESLPEQQVVRNVVAGHEFPEWQKQSRLLESMAAYTYSGGSFNLASGGREPVTLVGARVTAGFFPTLGVPPALGRIFRAEEDRPGAGRIVVLSHDAWRVHFGADPRVIGTTVRLNDEPYSVVGVMPAGFTYPPTPELGDVQVWAPIAEPIWRYRGRHYLFVLGRLRSGVDIRAAQAEFDTITRRLEAANPDVNQGHRAFLSPLHDELVASVRPGLLALYGSAAVVLLVACVNVASMLLARGVSRQQEVALRAALGAGTFRLARQFTVESLVLCLAGAAGGLLLASWSLPALLATSPVAIPRTGDVGMSGTVLGVTAAVTLLTGVLFGWARLQQARRADPNSSLKNGHVLSPGAGRHRLLSGLVVSEVALAVLLLAAAGVMTKSVLELLRVDPGFQPARVWTMSLSLPGTRYPKAQDRTRFVSQLATKLRALPGVTEVGIVNHLPLGGSYETTGIAIEGRPESQDPPTAGLSVVSPGYFRAMGIPLADGRTFEDADARLAVPIIRYYEEQPFPPRFDEPQPPPVAVVSRAAARRFWPGGTAIGRRIRVEHSPWITVIGVVGDIRRIQLQADPQPDVYLMAQQEPQSTFNVVVRTGADSDELGTAMRQQVWAVDKEQPVLGLRRLADVVADGVSLPRVGATLTAAFAVVALLLAALGVYGVLSFVTGQRRREIGLRLAMGAERKDILRLVVGRGAVLVLSGLVLGLAGFVGLSRLLASLLYRTSPTDVVVLLATTGILLLVGLCACYLPARQATDVDPLTALRAE